MDNRAETNKEWTPKIKVYRNGERLSVALYHKDILEVVIKNYLIEDIEENINNLKLVYDQNLVDELLLYSKKLLSYNVLNKPIKFFYGEDKPH